jgi:hypothetical protein
MPRGRPPWECAPLGCLTTIPGSVMPSSRRSRRARPGYGPQGVEPGDYCFSPTSAAQRPRLALRPPRRPAAGATATRHTQPSSTTRRTRRPATPGASAPTGLSPGTRAWGVPLRLLCGSLDSFSQPADTRTAASALGPEASVLEVEGGSYNVLGFSECAITARNDWARSPAEPPPRTLGQRLPSRLPMRRPDTPRSSVPSIGNKPSSSSSRVLGRSHRAA